MNKRNTKLQVNINLRINVKIKRTFLTEARCKYATTTEDSMRYTDYYSYDGCVFFCDVATGTGIDMESLIDGESCWKSFFEI